MGLDIGDARTGVAVSDLMGIIAQPHGIVPCSNPADDAAAIADLAKELEVIGIVAGLPLDQNGEMGPQAEKVMAVVEQMRELIEVPVDTIDERFTTAFAQRTLQASGMKSKKRKGKKKQGLVDQLAAQQILQTYLDRKAHQGK